MKGINFYTTKQIDKMLRNPMDIHTIQDKLLAIESRSVFAHAVRLSAKNDLNECLQMIRSQAKDNRPLVAHIIGEDLLKKIEAI